MADNEYPPIDIPMPEVVEFTGWGWPLPVPHGGCNLCACPPESMPMVFRGTGSCSENHRKAQLTMENDA